MSRQRVRGTRVPKARDQRGRARGAHWAGFMGSERQRGAHLGARRASRDLARKIEKAKGGRLAPPSTCQNPDYGEFRRRQVRAGRRVKAHPLSGAVITHYLTWTQLVAVYRQRKQRTDSTKRGPRTGFRDIEGYHRDITADDENTGAKAIDTTND